MTVEQELEIAEQRVRNRKGKTRESAVTAARTRVLQQFGIKSQQPRQFADPATMI